MLAKWREGYDVVYGQRMSRGSEGVFKRITAYLFYRIINRLSDVPIPPDVGDFRLMDRRVVDALRNMPERYRLLRGMVSWVGFRQTAVTYERADRFAGTTKYPFRKMLSLATDGIVSFSTVPLRVMTVLGFSVFLLALIGISYALFLRLAFGSTHGWWQLAIAKAVVIAVATPVVVRLRRALPRHHVRPHRGPWRKGHGLHPQDR